MTVPAYPNLHPCPECGDDAALATAPGPGEPINEYDCTACAHQFTVGPAVLAPARPYPNLHRIAYGEGARLTAEARVEAADALERLNRRCDGCKFWTLGSPHGPQHGACGADAIRPVPPLFAAGFCPADHAHDVWVGAFTAADHACNAWQPITPAHDKEKS